MRTEDAHIIYRCLNGDSASFSLLVEKYQSKIHALAYNKLKNFHDAEDVRKRKCSASVRIVNY
jgi:DNA-directed RNA polymerase specialized sigma24 family protein